ncbi:MAG: hypothetical protein HZA25_01165 [Candidatus Niyogibacteria bacterium]|nr:hypothetical protein [Candidatus Niyogibacteria bacterium]
MKIDRNFLSAIGVALFAAVFFSGAHLAVAKAMPSPIDDLVIDEILAPTKGDGAEVATTATGPSCFDYYHFQSVQVSVNTDKDKYAASDKVVFSGELINQNDYPVVDGYVFVRVSKDNSNYLTEGRHIVDEFFGAEKVTLDAGATKNIQFDWRIPAVSAGKYHADYFFSVGKKFNLGGLPFSNEVIIGSADFAVESNNDWIYFDRAGTQVNGAKYVHIGGWPMVDPGSAATITQPIKNTFKQAQKISVKYELYRWDSLLAEDKISEKSENVSVPANSSAALSYTIPVISEPVYYLKITATTGDQQSIVNIRVVSDLERPRLNYPAITKFPLAKGDAYTLFSCFHNSSGVDTSGKVLLTLSDKDGQKVQRMEYDGKITSMMMVDRSDLTAAKAYDYLKLKATVLDKNGKTVDDYEAVYDCNAIDASKCQKTYWPYYALGIALLILIVAAVWWGRRRRSDLPVMMVGLIILASAWYFQTPEPVSSATTQSQTQIRTVTGSNTLKLGDTRDRRDILYWNASVAHKVSVDATTHGKNYSLAINDPISFTYSNIGTYNGTSGAWDTPYLGEIFTFGGGSAVVIDKVNPRLQYDSGFPVPILQTNGLPWYQWGQDPAVYVSSSNSGVVSCSTAMNCKAVGYGTATLTANIALTRVAVSNAHIWWNPCSDHYWDLFNDTCGRDMYLTGNSADLPATAASWTITVPTPAVIGSGAAKYKCSGSACVQDNTNGTYTTSNCDGACGVGVDGVCDNTVVNTCSAGTFSDLSDTTTAYQWQCLGQNGGANSGTCSKLIGAGSARYKCSNNACTRDDAAGSYTASNCNNACSAGGGYCGNSVTEGFEQCDDGNTVSNDGCSSTCQIEGGGGINGVCKNGVRDGCSAGTFSDLTDTATAYRWQCLGQSGGTNSGTCSVTISSCVSYCTLVPAGGSDGCGGTCGNIIKNGVTASITASPMSIGMGGSSILTLTCGNATNYSVSDGSSVISSGAYATPMKVTVTPTASKTYTLTCSSKSTKNATASVKVSVPSWQETSLWRLLAGV